MNARCILAVQLLIARRVLALLPLTGVWDSDEACEWPNRELLPIMYKFSEGSNNTPAPKPMPGRKTVTSNLCQRRLLEHVVSILVTPEGFS